MAATTQTALEAAIAKIDHVFARGPKVRQSTPAEMAAARAAVQASRDAELAPKVARLAAAPADMSGLTHDQLSGLIYDALALYPRDAGYEMGQRVNAAAHAERARRAAPCALKIAAE